MSIHNELVRVLMAYDRKESTKTGYNIYAMPMYLDAASKVADRVDAGEDLRTVIVESFHGRLCGAVLRGFKLPVNVA